MEPQIYQIRTQAVQDTSINKIPNAENEERILKAATEKHQGSFRGKQIRLTSDFSTQTLKIKEC